MCSNKMPWEGKLLPPGIMCAFSVIFHLRMEGKLFPDFNNCGQ